MLVDSKMFLPAAVQASKRVPLGGQVGLPMQDTAETLHVLWQLLATLRALVVALSIAA